MVAKWSQNGACCLVASGGSRSSCRYKNALRSLQLQPRLLALSRVIACHLLLEKTHARPRGPSATAARDKRKLTPQLQARPATTQSDPHRRGYLPVPLSLPGVLPRACLIDRSQTESGNGLRILFGAAALPQLAWVGRRAATRRV